MDSDKKEKNLAIYTISSQIPDDKKINSRPKWWHIDKEMVRFKLHFFLFIGALGTACPYLTVFAKNRVGISASCLAAILTTQQFMFIFTKPLMGYLADYFNKLKAMICLLTVIPIIFMFLLLPIPRIQVEENIRKIDLKSLFEEKNNFNLRDICNVSQEDDAPLLNSIKTNVVCSLSSYNLPKSNEKCSKIISIQSNKTDFKSDHSSTFISSPSWSGIDSSLCSSCCNTTDDCSIFFCPDAENSAKETTSEVSQFKAYQFWLFAIVLTVAMASINALFTLSDTACCESVVKTGADFGRQRLYGAIGWGTMAPIGGLLHDYTDDYLPGWIIMGVMLIMSLWNIWKIDLVQPQFSQNILKDVGKVLSSSEFLAFELGVLMNGIGCGIIWFYQIWFLTTIGASRFLCGFVQTVQCFAGEIPFMFFSGWFIKKLGHFNVLTLSLAAYCARFFFYSYLHNPWLVLPMEIVHGFTYGLFYSAVASYAKLSAKPGTEATTQSILFSTQEGLGAGLGCVIAGLGFDSIGGHQTFFYASIFCGCGIFVNIAFTLWNRKQKKSLTVTTPVTKQSL